jgi:hypothetical protein
MKKLLARCIIISPLAMLLGTAICLEGVWKVGETIVLVLVGLVALAAFCQAWAWALEELQK